MRSQKGQGLLEFAFVLPFLILIMFGLFYAGMLFSDYIELNNLARTAAREAAVISQEDFDKNKESDPYKSVRDKFTTAAKSSSDYKKHFLPNSLYIWDFKDDSRFQMTYNTDGSQSVTVVLVADVNSADGGIYNSLSKQFNVAQRMTVEYTMHSEYSHTTETTDG